MISSRAGLTGALAEYLEERLQPAEEALSRALELFRKLGDRKGEADALEVLGRITDVLRGKLTKAQGAYGKAIDLYRALGDDQGMARTMARLRPCLLKTGAPGGARPP